MDINLPGISGIEALKILREDPVTAHIPVVALSANAMPRDIEKGLEAGFFRYLTKPIKVDEFMETLDVALEFAAREVGQSQGRTAMKLSDELGDMAAIFGRMAADLKDSQDKVLSYGRGLETIIAERTAELVEQKANLEASVADRTAQLKAANVELRSQASELSKRNQEITLFSKMNDFLQTSTTEAEAYSDHFRNGHAAVSSGLGRGVRSQLRSRHAGSRRRMGPAAACQLDISPERMLVASTRTGSSRGRSRRTMSSCD